MGLVLIAGGAAVVAVIAAVLFLPQTASLFPQPGQILDSFQADVKDLERQAATAAGDVVGNATEAVGAKAGVTSATLSPAPPPPPPPPPPSAGQNEGVGATAKAAAAESAIGPLRSLLP